MTRRWSIWFVERIFLAFITNVFYGSAWLMIKARIFMLLENRGKTLTYVNRKMLCLLFNYRKYPVTH